MVLLLDWAIVSVTVSHGASHSVILMSLVDIASIIIGIIQNHFDFE